MTKTITVRGMSCSGCEEAVEEALERLPGVISASADHGTDSVEIEGDEDPSAIVAAVDEAGYEASM